MSTTSAPTFGGTAPLEPHNNDQIKINSDSTHSCNSKTVPTASLAPFPADLLAFEVGAFLAKIVILATKSDFPKPRDDKMAKKHFFDQISAKK